MANVKDINCTIVNIHGRVSCQPGVSVGIGKYCDRAAYTDMHFGSDCLNYNL